MLFHLFSICLIFFEYGWKIKRQSQLHFFFPAYSSSVFHVSSQAYTATKFEYIINHHYTSATLAMIYTA